MTYLEGILVSSDGHVNTAAMGARIQGDTLHARVFIPSDTARNLGKNHRFTFSLTADPELFFKGALTGHDSPGEPELEEDEMVSTDGFYYPKKASKVHFCHITSIIKRTVRDEYGRGELLDVTASILRVQGDERFIGREHPLVDVMVHLSRYSMVGEEQKRVMEARVKELSSDPTGKKIMEWMESQP